MSVTLMLQLCASTAPFEVARPSLRPRLSHVNLSLPFGGGFQTTGPGCLVWRVILTGSNMSDNLETCTQPCSATLRLLHLNAELKGLCVARRSSSASPGLRGPERKFRFHPMRKAARSAAVKRYTKSSSALLAPEPQIRVSRPRHWSSWPPAVESRQAKFAVQARHRAK